jgi:hypothetical protein
MLPPVGAKCGVGRYAGYSAWIARTTALNAPGKPFFKFRSSQLLGEAEGADAELP